MNKELKKKIRKSTSKHFRKDGMCKRCFSETETQWHHKVYKRVCEGLSKKKKDIIEVCHRCHKRLESEKCQQQKKKE